MYDPEIRDIILAAAGRHQSHLAAGIVRTFWPGGQADRSDPASAWLQRWRPLQTAMAMPSCTCETGGCPICN